MEEIYVGLHCSDACRESRIFKLNELEKIFRGLRRSPWYPKILCWHISRWLRCLSAPFRKVKQPFSS